MMNAYNESYRNDAQKTLALMFDYAVNDCKFDIDWIANLFVMSGYSKLFEAGNAVFISGVSGVELAGAVIRYAYPDDNIRRQDASQTTDKSAEYWAGWALADYQWFSSYRFSDIFERVKMSDIVKMYPLYHEMDITQFREAIDEKMQGVLLETKLKRIREARGLSQSELAKLTGVSLRSIQMYEQRGNDIDKAQGKTLYKLSVVLGCQIEDLLEAPNR